jgi:hypothetical protein
MWLLKSQLDLRWTTIRFLSNCDFKSHINFRRIKIRQKKWFLALLDSCMIKM